MKLFLGTALFCIAGFNLFAQQDTRYFELRTYYCTPGKVGALETRFNEVAIPIFKKLKMECLGYWRPVDDKQSLFVDIMVFPSKKAAKESWDAFLADPDWKAFNAKKPEKITDSVRSVFMNPTDILPTINSSAGGGERVFELRTYTCLPGRLPNLLARFKNHTTKLFEKHGMVNIVYFTSEEGAGVQPKLIYLLAHQDMEAAKKSWDEFRTDPAWIEARDASEKDGKIVDKVVSLYLRPLSFSKMK